jgi:hypothetical protein
MASALTSLEERIVEILKGSGSKPLSLPDVEKALVESGYDQANTFDVREAVLSLIDKGQADFTPSWYVKAAGS